jgi:hypothetical protein
MILACYISEIVNTNTENWVHARRGAADDAFNRFVQSLNDSEFFSLAIANRVNFVIDWSLPDRAHGISLPTDGDLLSEPGILNAVVVSTSDEWTELLGEWPDLPPPNDGADIFQTNQFLELAIEMAEHDIRPPLGSAGPPMSSTKPTSTVQERATASPATEAPSTWMVTKMQRAEIDLCAALGDDVYYSLCPDARSNATQAQYLSFDADAPLHNGIITHLATAFEVQAKDRLIKPFLDDLDFRGRKPWNFSWGFTFVSVDRMSLGNIESLLRNAEPDFVQFLHSRSFDLTQLRFHLPLIRKKRNEATHGGRVFPYGEACWIRDQWLGVERGDGGIFGLLRPTKSPI